MHPFRQEFKTDASADLNDLIAMDKYFSSSKISTAAKCARKSGDVIESARNEHQTPRRPSTKRSLFAQKCLAERSNNGHTKAIEKLVENIGDKRYGDQKIVPNTRITPIRASGDRAFKSLMEESEIEGMEKLGAMSITEKRELFENVSSALSPETLSFLKNRRLAKEKSKQESFELRKRKDESFCERSNGVIDASPLSCIFPGEEKFNIRGETITDEREDFLTLSSLTTVLLKTNTPMSYRTQALTSLSRIFREENYTAISKVGNVAHAVRYSLESTSPQIQRLAVNCVSASLLNDENAFSWRLRDGRMKWKTNVKRTPCTFSFTDEVEENSLFYQIPTKQELWKNSDFAGEWLKSKTHERLAWIIMNSDVCENTIFKAIKSIDKLLMRCPSISKDLSDLILFCSKNFVMQLSPPGIEECDSVDQSIVICVLELTTHFAATFLSNAAFVLHKLVPIIASAIDPWRMYFMNGTASSFSWQIMRVCSLLDMTLLSYGLNYTAPFPWSLVLQSISSINSETVVDDIILLQLQLFLTSIRSPNYVVRGHERALIGSCAEKIIYLVENRMGLLRPEQSSFLSVTLEIMLAAKSRFDYSEKNDVITRLICIHCEHAEEISTEVLSTFLKWCYYNQEHLPKISNAPWSIQQNDRQVNDVDSMYWYLKLHDKQYERDLYLKALEFVSICGPGDEQMCWDIFCSIIIDEQFLKSIQIRDPQLVQKVLLEKYRHRLISNISLHFSQVRKPLSLTIDLTMPYFMLRASSSWIWLELSKIKDTAALEAVLEWIASFSKFCDLQKPTSQLFIVALEELWMICLKDGLNSSCIGYLCVILRCLPLPVQLDHLNFHILYNCIAPTFHQLLTLHGQCYRLMANIVLLLLNKKIFPIDFQLLVWRQIDDFFGDGTALRHFFHQIDMFMDDNNSIRYFNGVPNETDVDIAWSSYQKRLRKQLLMPESLFNIYSKLILRGTICASYAPKLWKIVGYDWLCVIQQN